MNTSNGMWVPSYYRRRHPLSWIRRGAGGPKVVDWLAGAVFAVLVLGLVALARAPQHHWTRSAAVTATTASKDSNINPDRMAYAPRPSAVDK